MNSSQPPKNNTKKAGSSKSNRWEVKTDSSISIINSSRITMANDSCNSVPKKDKSSAAHENYVRINNRCSPRGSINQDATGRPKPAPPPSKLLPSTK